MRMERARAGLIGALVLVVINLIFDLLTFPTYASYGYKYLRITEPFYYFVTTVIISFGIGLAGSLLYMIVRHDIPYPSIWKGVVYGLLLWGLVTCTGVAQLIAQTTLPIVYDMIWLLQGLISYMIYGIVLWYTLEPHAHKWLHPAVIEHARKTKGEKGVAEVIKQHKEMIKKK